MRPRGVHLLGRAQRDGVEDIPGLRKWLKQAERQGEYTAVSSLGMALNRLTASPSLREWLEWPVNRFDILPAGALFFACKGTSWERQHLLQAVLLAAMQMPDVRLIAHGFPWKAVGVAKMGMHESLIVSNGPHLPSTTTVLVQAQAHSEKLLADRFLTDQPMLADNLQMLQMGAGIVV